MVSTVVLAALLVAAQARDVSASLAHGAFAHGAPALLARAADLHHHLARDASRALAAVAPRQNAPSAPSAAAPDPTISTMPQSGNAANANLTVWEQQTEQACMTALMSADAQSMNPSGMAVCYDVPFFDNTTGVFQAELRMYNMSPPTGAWAGITVQDISLTMSYLGATVQATNGTAATSKRDVEPSRSAHAASVRLSERQDTGSTASMPAEIQILTYVGMVNKNMMAVMSAPAVQQFLVPEISLIGQSPNANNGQAVVATLGSTSASFDGGVFTRQATNPTVNNAAAAASATSAVAKAAPFVLPGTKLAFFPVGLVVTCIWTGGLFLAVGLGTFGRMKFRDQYRRRVRRDVAAGVQRL